MMKMDYQLRKLNRRPGKPLKPSFMARAKRVGGMADGGFVKNVSEDKAVLEQLYKNFKTK